jgi:hypothetical protein
VKPLLQAAGLWDDEYDALPRHEWLQRVLQLVLPRVKRLPDFVDQARPFLAAAVDYDPEAVRKYLGTADLDDHVETLIIAFEADAGPFDELSIERVLRGRCAQQAPR